MPTEQHTAVRDFNGILTSTPGAALATWRKGRALHFHLGAWLKILAVKCACDGEPERRVVAVQLTEGKGP